MVSNSHTGAFLDLDWLDGIYEQNENMMGVVFSENHNAGISERDRRITYMDALVKQAAKWGGYVINCDMNDAPKDTGGSDHGGTLEYFLNNETLYQTLKKYSQNYILLAKTTSAWMISSPPTSRTPKTSMEREMHQMYFEVTLGS